MSNQRELIQRCMRLVTSEFGVHRIGPVSIEINGEELWVFLDSEVIYYSRPAGVGLSRDRGIAAALRVLREHMVLNDLANIT